MNEIDTTNDELDIIVQEEEVEVSDKTVDDPYEEAAREQGWKPKSEWQGDPDKWRDSQEFVERGELYSKIDTMGRDLKDTKKALKMLQEHHSKLKEVEYKKAVEELKAAQKKNLETGDADAYLETTELLTDLKAEQKAREVYQEQMPEQVDPRFTAWVEKNKWYAQEPAMKKHADLIGEVYARQNPDLEPVDVLAYVAKEIREKFKEKFVNPNRNKQTVEGRGLSAPTPKGKIELTAEEVKVMNTFIRTGTMTKEQYLEEVKAMRGSK